MRGFGSSAFVPDSRHSRLHGQCFAVCPRFRRKVLGSNGVQALGNATELARAAEIRRISCRFGGASEQNEGDGVFALAFAQPERWRLPNDPYELKPEIEAEIVDEGV